MGHRIFFNGTAKDGNGKVVCGATISVFLAGSTTTANIYSTLTGTTVITSKTSGSATSSNPGYWSFYTDAFDYDAEQLFKISISKAGFTTQPYDNQKGEIVLGTYTVSAVTTVITHVIIPKGVLYAKSGSGSIAFNGITEIGNYQVFDSTFSSGITFGSGSISEVYPEWFQTNTTPGTTDMAVGIGSAYASISKGKIPFLPTKYLTSGMLTAKDGMWLAGAGGGNTDGTENGTTVIKYTGTNHWIDVPLNTPIPAMSITGMEILVTEGDGAIWVNRPSLVFSENQFSMNWTLRDLKITHSTGVAGSVGLSLTQLAVSRLEDIKVGGFEKNILDRNGTDNILNHIRVQALTTGATAIHFQGTSGTLQEYVYGLDVGCTALNSTGIDLDAGNVQFYGVFIESSSTLLPTAMLKVTSVGQSSLIHGIVWSNQIANCPLIVVDASCSYGPNITDGIVLSASYTQITVGAASTLTLNNPNTNLIGASVTARQQGRVYIHSFLQRPEKYVTSKNATQEIANDTYTLVTWPAELYESSFELMGATANTITVLTPGFYLFTVNLGWESNATGDRRIDLEENGTTIIASDLKYAAPSMSTKHSLSVIGYVPSSGTTYIVKCQQTSTGALNLEAYGTFSAHFLSYP